MGRNDSSMQNISQVEIYAKLLDSVNVEVTRIFDNLKRKTDEVGGNWSDAQFEQFHEMFNNNIIKQIKGICLTLENLSKYTKRQCQVHHQAQQIRL